MDTNEKNPKKPNEFICKYCDFNSCNKKDYNRHLSTDKHLLLTNPNLKNPKTLFYNCICGKSYKHSSSLSAHKKKCNDINMSNDEIGDKDQLILMLIKQNSELIKETSGFKNMMIEQQNMMMEQQNIMMEVIKNGTNNTTNTNSHNKTFNLQFFLNETCKDAMNIMDFVDSIKLQLTDLEKVGTLGFVEGISNIIVKNLNSLDETQRPVHCTDTKREVMYVKDKNKWEKENENKQKIRKAIKGVVYKNSKLLNNFRANHPDCIKSDSRYSDQYNKLVIEAFGGKGDNDVEKEDKIIRNIAKQVTINKEPL
jgi:hypothetical protein